MKVGIKLIALLLYLILATKAAPTGNGNAGGGENEGGEAGEAGEAGENEGAGEAGEIGEQGEVGEAGEQGEIGEQEGLGEGGEVGEEGENAVTDKYQTAISKSRAATTVAPTNEEPEATSFVTEAATTKQRAGVASSVVPAVAPYRPIMNNMPLVTLNDFNYLDKNGDRFLDYKELFLGPYNFNPVYLNAAFQISDKNFDGVVDQPEFFRHPLSWGRVVAERQFFEKDINTSGTDATELISGQPDITPTAEQTYTASPDGTPPQPSEDQVTTTVPSADQSTTGQSAVDQQPSVSTDAATRPTRGQVSVVDKTNGRIAPTRRTTGQTRTQPQVTQRPKDKAGYQPIGTGVVLIRGQPTAGKGGAVAGSTGGQAGMVTGQKEGQVRTGARPFDGQPRAVPSSVGGHANGLKGGQAGIAGAVGGHAVAVAGKTRGHAGTAAGSHGDQHRKAVSNGVQAQAGTAAGSVERPAVTAASIEGHAGGVAGKTRGQPTRGHAGTTSKSTGAGEYATSPSGRRETGAATRLTGVQAGVSVHPAGKFRGHIGVSGLSHTAPVTRPWNGQGHVRPQYYVWDGQRWIKADVEQGVNRETAGIIYGKPKGSEYKGAAKSASITDEKKYSPHQEEKDTKAVAQSEEEADDQTSKEEEDKKHKSKNGKGNSDNESEDTEDKDENDDK